MKKHLFIGLLLGGLLVVQSHTAKASVPDEAKKGTTPVRVDAKESGKAQAKSFITSVKDSFKDFFDKTTYEKSSVTIGVPVPKQLIDIVNGAPDFIKNALEKLNKGPLTKLNFVFDFGYGGAGADQTGDLAMSKGFVHLDAQGAAPKIVELLFKLPIPDEIKNPINNMLGLKGSTVCLIKMMLLAKKPFIDPNTKKTDTEARYAFISKELPLLLTRLAFTPDFHGPADWISSFIKPFGLESVVESLKLPITADVYYEWKKYQKAPGASDFYKALSKVFENPKVMDQYKALNALMLTTDLKKLDWFDRDLLVNVLGGIVDDLASAYDKKDLKPETNALLTRAVILTESEDKEVKATEEPLEGYVGLVTVLNTVNDAASKAGNFKSTRPGEYTDQPMQGDLSGMLQQMLATVTAISKNEKLPATKPSTKLVERISISLTDYMRVYYDFFMNNYWNRMFEGDTGYVKPIPTKGTLITVSKDLAAMGVRVLQFYSDANITYQKTDDGKKAMAAIAAAKKAVDDAVKAFTAFYAKDPKQANDDTKKAVAAVQDAKKNLSKAKKEFFKGMIKVSIPMFYKWETSPTGALTRTIIPDAKDTPRNFMAREILRAFMKLPQWGAIKNVINGILSVFGITMEDLGISEEGLKSDAIKEAEKKAKELEEQGQKALEAALATLEVPETEPTAATEETAATVEEVSTEVTETAPATEETVTASDAE